MKTIASLGPGLFARGVVSVAKNDLLKKADLQASKIDINFPDGIMGPVVLATQATAHTLQRHAFQQAKNAIDLGDFKKYVNDVKENGPVNTFQKGLAARFGYIFLLMLPAKSARQAYAANNPESSQYTQAAVATLAESVPGVAVEVSATKASLERNGVKMSAPFNPQNPVFRAAYSASIVPYTLRNGTGWVAAFYVTPQGEIGIGDRFCIGVFGGAVSSPLDFVGSKMMAGAARARSEGSSLSDSVVQAAVKSFQEVVQNPKAAASTVAKGSVFRALPGGAGAVIFSDDGAKAIRQIYAGIYETLSEMGEQGQKILQEIMDVPSQKIEKPKADNLSKSNQKDAPEQKSGRQ